MAFLVACVGISNYWVLMPPDGQLSQYPFQVMNGAYFGVETFFALSGFLGTLSILAKFQVRAWRYWDCFVERTAYHTCVHDSIYTVCWVGCVCCAVLAVSLC